MQNPAPAAAPKRLPAAIEAALSAVAILQGVKPAHRAALAEIVRCANATEPGRRFRVSIPHLMARLERSDATVDRYLAALRGAGWICREQPTRGARRHGWRAAWTWLTDKALQALRLAPAAPVDNPPAAELQRGSKTLHHPNPVSQGEAASRVRRIPHDLEPLAARIGARRVVWLMAECRKRGQRLQAFAAQALQADKPAGFVMHALRALQRSTWPAQPRAGAQVASGATGGSERVSARQQFAQHDAANAGARTEAGRDIARELRARFVRRK